MSAFSFKEMGMYQINTGGNLVCERITNRYGEVTALYPYAWQTVSIDRDQASKKLVYTIRQDANEPIHRLRGQVFHVAGPSFNGIDGMSPIEYAAAAVRLGLTYEQFGISFYKNGAIPSGIFQHPTDLKDEPYKRLKEDLEKNYQGLMNSGRPLLLEGGMQFKELTMKLGDAQLLESKKFQIEDICRVYRVPLHLVQNLDKATNNNIEHQSLEFVMYTMLPWFKRWEDAINTQLLTLEQRNAGYYFEFNVSSLLRGDSKSMAEAFAVGRQWGWLSVNDIRRLLNMNPIPNGDIYLQPMNMIEAGSQSVDPAIKAEIERLIEASRVK
jgi:HK97 family phage portal protein